MPGYLSCFTPFYLSYRMLTIICLLFWFGFLFVHALMGLKCCILACRDILLLYLLIHFLILWILSDSLIFSSHKIQIKINQWHSISIAIGIRKIGRSSTQSIIYYYHNYWYTTVLQLLVLQGSLIIQQTIKNKIQQKSTTHFFQ